MCGLTGFLDFTRERTEPELQRIIEAMTETIRHRGPDDGGVWTDPEAGIALGSRRLAIVDLSSEGHQPMFSASGRFVIAFNGEIYNYEAIRAELEPARWRGGSDTEVLLAAIERWGLASALSRTVGMFALALWDRKERVLQLARDRMGEKPLHYGWMGQTLLFGSELKTFRPHPLFKPEIDRGAVALFMRHGYVPSPWTIYDGVRKLPPASIATIRPAEGPGAVSIQTYWSLSQAAERGIRHQFQGSETEAKAALDGQLRQAVRGQMVADVPVGAFLSGGIDSSALVSIMQALSDRPVRTFTIGFNEAEYNESEHARAVARHLGTDHTDLYVSPTDALNVIPQLPWIYDEPFADPSQIPTVVLSRLTRQHVTVSLSGDGGDELFRGYERYFRADRIRGVMDRFPSPVRRAALSGATAISPASWDRAFGLLRRGGGQLSGHRVHTVATLLSQRDDAGLYRSMMSTWRNASSVVLGATPRPTAFDDPAVWTRVDHFHDRMMHLDQVDYLPEDLLVKVDRASMAASLESRAPFLDHRLVEFAWTVPLAMKTRGDKGKWLLRQVLDDYVPAQLIDRPKMGFGVPLAEWLRGPLRDWAEDLIDERRLADEGFFDPAPIRADWVEHQSGKRDWKYKLWTVLMFQAWLAAERDQAEYATLRETPLAVR